MARFKNRGDIRAVDLAQGKSEIQIRGSFYVLRGHTTQRLRSESNFLDWIGHGSVLVQG